MASAGDRISLIRAHRAPRRPRRGGFTLIEMLVVVSIGLLMLALAVGGLANHKESNRLLATEQLVADWVRQARHTARSTGAPVMLRISQVLDAHGVAIGGRIAGVSRTCLWSQSFDELANFIPVGGPPDSRLNNLRFTADPGTGLFSDPDPATGLTIGRSGHGVWPKHVPDGTVAGYDDMRPTLLTWPLDRGHQLVHGTAPNLRSDGFYIACCVRPPAAVNIPMTAAGDPPYVIPLVVIGGADATMNTATAGLMLQRGQLDLPTPGGTVSLPTWMAVGWINHQGVGAQESASFPAAGGADITAPIGGDRWEDLGLLYDGKHLAIYRNGHLMGETALASTAPLIPNDPESVYIGQLIRVPGVIEMADAPLDDIQIYRLGTDQAGDLPTTVVPDNPGTLTIRPDGAQPEFAADTLAAPPAALAPALPAQRNASGAGAIAVVGSGQHDLIAPSSSANALVFSRRVQGARDKGPLNAAVVTINTDGTVASSLATIETDPATRIVYAVTDPPAP